MKNNTDFVNSITSATLKRNTTKKSAFTMHAECLL